MRKGLTEIVFVLDRSGSMSGLEKDTIGGFNSLIEKQKNEAGDAYVSVVLFDTNQEVIYDRVSIREVKPMTEEQYSVRGCTALLDALGKAIHHMGMAHKYARKEDLPEKTLFVITTDGMENSSRKYNYSKVRQMISDEKEKHGWEFIFLGANIDAIDEASKFGINANRAVRYECDSVGTALNFTVVDKAISKVRTNKALDDDWSAEIENDFKARHNRDKR